MTFAPGGPHRQEAWLFQDALTPPSPPIPQRLLCWDRTVLLHSPTALIRPLQGRMCSCISDLCLGMIIRCHYSNIALQLPCRSWRKGK